MRNARGGTVLAFTLLFTTMSSAGLAYILPASAILESVGERRKALGFDALVLRGRFLNPKTNVTEKTVWKLVKPGEGVRTEIKGPHTTQISLLKNKKSYKFSPGVPPQKGVPLKADLELDFLASTKGDPGGKRGRAFLSAHKIDRKVVSLSRMNKRIIWVIGALEGDLESPQLWIDKALRVPVRLIYGDETSGDKLDIQWLGFGSPQTREWHPRQVDTYRNDELVERLVFHKVMINPSVDAALLTTPKIK